MWFFRLVILILSAVGNNAAKCEQGSNCILPNCFCADGGMPGNIHPRNVPQMVVVALEGNMDRQRDEHYEQLFPKELLNPNGCQVSATMFVPGKSTDVNLVKKWYEKGMEIGINSQLGAPSYDYWSKITRQQMKEEVLVPLTSFVKDGKVLRQHITGYRSPAFFTAGNTQYQVLEYENFNYDASIRLSRRSIFDVNYWPSTLDYPWAQRCVVGRCPTNTYPGLWVVPSVTYFNGTEPARHSANLFAYASAFPATTAEETYQFLWNNFDAFYQNGRSPFIVNMNTVAFVGEGGSERLKGFQKFFRRLLEEEAVYMISMQKLIDWMKSPADIGKIGSISSWSCAASVTINKEQRKKGKPVKVNQLDRRSKFNVLYNNGEKITLSALLCSFTVSVALWTTRCKI